MEIKIGADELILWLKKNNKANGIENMELGRRILRLMNSLNAEMAERHDPTLWSLSLDNNLPKTSQQYIIDIDKLPDLFKELSNW